MNLQRYAFCLPLLLTLFATPLVADTGVLIPLGKSQPDPGILSIGDLQVNIRIDNGDADVWVRETFINHTGKREEGNYVFALPGDSTVSDFAVWDGPVRIPAVILERKRAQQLYSVLKTESIDPGLLEQGQTGKKNAKHTSTFSAHIVPIHPWGTKRLEMEYHQTIPVDSLKSYFAFPFRPSAYQLQTAAHVQIHFELHSAQPIQHFAQQDTLFPLKLTQQSAHTVTGDYTGTNVSLGQDFEVTWQLEPSSANHLDVLTYRNPKAPPPSPAVFTPSPGSSQLQPGFFEASALIGMPAGASPKADSPQNLVILFDNSLSMQWEKLQRTYAAMEKLLHSRGPQDHFNLLLFNSRTRAFSPHPVIATVANIDRAIHFVRTSDLRGGTNLQRALKAGLAQCTLPHSALVLLTDGGTDGGIIQGGKLGDWYTTQWDAVAPSDRPRTDIFAVGDSADRPLLRLLSRGRGVLESVTSTEPLRFKLNAFLSRINNVPVGQLSFAASPAAAVDEVYPLHASTFAGSVAAWVGEYHHPQRDVSVTVHALDNGQPLNLRSKVNLPAASFDHPGLPRLWAHARVEALLAQIERNGETKSAVDEIIRLSRRYKFVTPYTSFLAAPRALLRPRIIRPGDPVLRVHTDPSIVSVVALFPFGLIRPLRFLPDEHAWQTRFLAPPSMRNGTYTVRLILRDKHGRAYRETKTFVIASTPPTVRIHLASHRFHPGEVVPLRVSASRTTRTLTAHLQDFAPVSLHWNPSVGEDTGQLIVPQTLPAGDYTLTVTAEDIAHNQGTEELRIAVVP